MGYSWGGRCWPDVNTARDAFVRDVSAVDPTGLTVPGTITVNASGVVSWSIIYRSFGSTLVYTRTGTTQLATCTTPDLTNYSEQSLFFIAALFFAAVVGFKTGFNSYI